MNNQEPFTILTLRDVCKKVTLSKTSVYTMIKENRFPKPIKLGLRMNGWIESEIDAWIAERVAERDALSSTATTERKR